MLCGAGFRAAGRWLARNRGAMFGQAAQTEAFWRGE